MSKPERGDANERPSDTLILAAVERAALHRAKEPAQAPTLAVLAHLDLRKRSAGARLLAARLHELERRGELRRVREHGIAMWRLTAAGARRLRREQRIGIVAQLPESPQHRDWRNARMSATQEIDRFRAQLEQTLRDAAALVSRSGTVHSDDWFELGRLLQRRCWLLGSASHCLYEWREPSDARADHDGHRDDGDEALAPDERIRRRARRRGRRNVRLWQEPW